MQKTNLSLRKCIKCEGYTLKKECCKEQTKSAHPARFTPTDKLSKYRIEIKKKHNLLPTQKSEDIL
jgi:H/ACA ribonucleoprotein complex subunit 3